MTSIFQQKLTSNSSAICGSAEYPPNFLGLAWTKCSLLVSLLAACLTLPLRAQITNTLLHSIPAPPVGVQTGAGFGHSVAADDGYMVVGAPYDDYGAQNGGLVKVFDSNSGELRFLLPNPGPAAGDNFGRSVAISGGRVVVGADMDDTGAINAGCVYVYDLNSSTPTVPLFTLNNPNPENSDFFGISVAIFGTRVVVGASSKRTGAIKPGSAYVYDLTNNTPAVPTVTLNKPSPAANDNFGYSVAISGTRVVVGAYLDDFGVIDSGSAYVFDLSGSTPSAPVSVLNNPSPGGNDYFGISVAISNTRVVVGAYMDNTNVLDAGSAYVYDLNSGTPTVPVVTLNNPSPASQDYFGYSVAISSTRLLVGAYGDNTGGFAYFYDLESSSPSVSLDILDNPSPANLDGFGYSVACSDNMMVVGANLDDTGATNAGSAYIYELISGRPADEVITLNNPGPTLLDYFGSSMAISGNLMVAGAYRDDTGANDAGSAYVYDLSSSTPNVPLVTLNNPSPVANDYFGHSVAIYGTWVVVGASQDDTGATDTGSVYVYDLSSSTPSVPVTTLNNPSPEAFDNFGHSVAISGLRVVVAASDDDTGSIDSGSVYVYDLSSGTPKVPTATLNNPSPATSEYFGSAVAISGTRVAVGCYEDDTGATNAGKAYVYDLSSSAPTEPLAILNNPNPAEDDWFGYSVAISGTRVVVGAYLDDSGATDAGSTYVYELGNGAPILPVCTLNSPRPASEGNFGVSVSISGARVAVGALGEDTGAVRSGAVYVFDLISSVPVAPTAILNNPGPAVDDNFGHSVAIDGTMLAIGTPNDDMVAYNKGFAYVFGPEPVPDISVVQVGPLTNGTSSVYFGSEKVGGSAPLTFTLANSGTLALNLTGTPKVHLSGAHASDFQVSLMPGTPVAISSSTTFQVTFDPSAIGLRTALVSIESDDADESPYTFAISGTGRIASQTVQTIVFQAPQKLHLAESPFTLSASTISGLPVVFTVLSGPATVSGNVLTLTGVGAVKVRASQPGDTDFLAAASLERTITVAANPTTLTLTNLSQTYTGTPRPITVLGAAEAVDVTYPMGLIYVPTAPINAGSYSVKVVDGAVTKTGKLTITKAPLFVTPDDQRKFAGQANPVLTFSYGGFLSSDNAVKSVSKAPVISTKATPTSAGGLYPITASGGASDNYLFVHQQGTMKVESFAGSYEALLVDEDTRHPAAKLELTVAASSKSFSAKLTTPTETAAVGLSGTLTTHALTETATGTATLKKGTNTYLVTVILPLTGDFTAEARQNGTLLGDPTNGRKLLTLAKGQTLSYTGAHSALLAPAQPAAVGVPAGAGWAVATIDAKGLLKLVGKLADGTGLTASLAADVSSNPGYRMFSQPYTPARTGAFIAGALDLKQHPDMNERKYVAFEDEADLIWVKAPRQKDPSYHDGFGPMSTRFTLDPWLPPSPAKGSAAAITLAQLLGLSQPANEITVQHSAVSSDTFDDLPATLVLNPTTNAVSVIAPVNTTKWKVTITPKTGAFVGSFEMTDAGKKRLVPFAGMMRQPPSTDSGGLIGDGSFLLPSLLPAPNNEILSGELTFER